MDRYSNWPIIERAHDGAKGLVASLCQVFVTFGIPDELASDGGSEFSSSATAQFLQEWVVHHRMSSVAFPHSNLRAEVGVKITKRLIACNTNLNGDLNTNAFQWDAATKRRLSVSQRTRDDCPLKVGDHVHLQNQTGVYPTKLDKTGVVVETRQFDQYAVRIDGCGRPSLRNRKYLRKYLPVYASSRRHL